MRIISGIARGTKLYTLDNNNTRPTLDRVKESLFSIIQDELKDAIVLENIEEEKIEKWSSCARSNKQGS